MRLAYSSGFVEGNVSHKPYEPPPAQPARSLPPPVQAQVATDQPATQLFEVHADTKCGDVVVLVGSTDRLGNWDPHKGVQMETSEDAYPIWQTWITGCLPPCEFKFVILCGTGGVEWEQNANRSLKPLTNRFHAILGDERSVSRTCDSDAALFARRQEKLLLAAHMPAQSLQHDPAPTQLRAPSIIGSAVLPLSHDPPRVMPPVPMPHPVSPRSTPPPLALGSPFTPFVAYVAGNSVASSPCISREGSRLNLSRQLSVASCNGMHRSISGQSHSSIGGSRVSFSKELNDLPKHAC